MKKVLIVVSYYYEKVAQGLIKGSTEYFDNNKDDSLDRDILIQYKIIKSPGSFEIPFIINENKNSYDGFIALGCIIRGQTYHFDGRGWRVAPSASLCISGLPGVLIIPPPLK